MMVKIIKLWGRAGIRMRSSLITLVDVYVRFYRQVLSLDSDFVSILEY